ncbi:MAG: DUF1501 domain-containing protein [Saprospiraceae bacterium]|nr:DUF1501 domain-containing protein [Saprospiraceae bacterium]
MKNQHRRDFLKIAGLAGLGYTSKASTLFQLNNIGALSKLNNPEAEDYKALVCIYLEGGMDSYNVLVPLDIRHASYMVSRSNLALPKNVLLPISPNNVGSAQYGLHPSLKAVASYFNQGKAAMLTNIGTLLEPITKVQYEQNKGRVPLGLFSHSDQSNQWQTAISDNRITKGWAGRMADLMYTVNSNDLISMNISLSGTNVYQSGVNVVEFTVNNDGASGIYDYDADWGSNPAKKTAILKMLQAKYKDPFKQTYVNTFQRALDGSLSFNTAVQQSPVITTKFEDNDLSNKLKMIARTIAVRKQLGFKRQIFYLHYSGWDHHDELLDNQRSMLQTLDTAIDSFQKSVQELNIADNVVTFTMSEFARTLSSNGNGTDHAWGGNAMVIGNPVKGKQIYGNFPSLTLKSNIDLGNGVLIPELPNDLYFAELALWFGLRPNDLHDVFPNLGNFYAKGSTKAPIGFLTI